MTTAGAQLTHKEILTPGNVLFLFCDFTTPAKQKFLILAAINPGLLFLMINSEINTFKQSKQELLDAQVKIDQASHPFLDHDSYADCSKVIRHFNGEEVIRQFGSRLGSLRGKITNAVKAQIRAVVNDSRMLENRFKKAILRELVDS